MARHRDEDESSFRDETYLVGEEPAEAPAAESVELPVPPAVSVAASEGIDYRPLEEAVAPPDQDLQEVYVTRAGKAQALTIYEGLPQPESRGLPFFVKLVLILVAIGVVGSLPFLIKKTLVDLDGQETQVSLVSWFSALNSMTPEEKAMQKFSPAERDMMVTYRRVEQASFAAGGQMASTGLWPSGIKQLVDRGSIEPEQAVDAYGYDLLIRVQPDQEVKVISRGADGIEGTSDDIALYKERWTLPAEFENKRLTQSLTN